MIGPDTVDVLARALVSISTDDADGARAMLGGSQDESLLAHALARYLDHKAAGSVYDDPAAFGAFIRGGGNLGLYRETSGALAASYESRHPSSVLDIGCGDGMALAPALATSSWHPRRLDLLEPSSALLTSCLDVVGRVAPQTTTRAWPETIQSALRSFHQQSWDVAQSTFALHTLPHPERTGALVALRPFVASLVVVEFDVPDIKVGSEEHLRFLVRTYEQGLAEYDDNRDLVADGFLMPVLVGQLAPGAVRSTWEQPAAAWAAQLQEAGWHDVTTRPLVDYWSSPAFVLTARGDKID